MENAGTLHNALHVGFILEVTHFSVSSTDGKDQLPVMTEQNKHNIYIKNNWGFTTSERLLIKRKK